MTDVNETNQPLILVERHENVAVITLHRPEKRNAISRALAAQLRDALREVEDSRVVVLTGAGDKAFCAGMDLTERGEVTWATPLGVGGSQYWAETVEAIRRHPAVFVAAVNGVAVGGGLTLVNVCELAVAARRAQFGAPEMGFGSFPALSGPSTIRRVLPKHAAAMVFLAERIDAETALRWGMVNEVVDDSQVVRRAREIAARVAAHDPVVLGLGKRAVHDLAAMPWPEAIDHGIMVSGMVRSYTQKAS